MTSKQEPSKWQDIADNQEENVTKDERNEESLSKEIPEEVSIDSAEANASDTIEQMDYDTLQKKLFQAEELAHENWEKAVRATAETDNVRRRAERDVSSAHKYGSEKLITSLLPVIDSLEQALQAAESANDETIKSSKEGIELTLKLFADALTKANVVQLNPIGEAFDPNQHEAMSMQDAPNELPGSVIMVFQKGYVLNGRVIRPARVVVAKGQFIKVDKEV